MDPAIGTPAYSAAVLRAPLTLPCGVTLQNRLAKAATSEFMADARGRATLAHRTLYGTWATGGAGMLLTGNVQIDYRHLEHPGNVVIQGEQDADSLASLKAWSEAGKRGGSQMWMQLSHPGRQSNIRVNATPKAPSAVPLAIPGVKFGMPIALSNTEILDLIERFGRAASVARETGFDGVELQAAHGYLFSQFLSPRANVREDEWGGDLAGRARFLLETVKAVRTKVGSDFPIGVKLNSADFQRGGFSFEDSRTVAGWLDDASVDLIEISGGTWEQPKMANVEGGEPAFEPAVSKASRERGAYFTRFAPEIRRNLKRAKLMVTGGFRTAGGMADAIENDGVDLVGLARPLCLYPEAAKALLSGELTGLELPESKLRLGPGILGPHSPIKLLRAINGLGSVTWYNKQLLRLAVGLPPDPTTRFLPAFVSLQRRERLMAKALEQGM